MKNARTCVFFTPLCRCSKLLTSPVIFSPAHYVEHSTLSTTPASRASLQPWATLSFITRPRQPASFPACKPDTNFFSSVPCSPRRQRDAMCYLPSIRFSLQAVFSCLSARRETLIDDQRSIFSIAVTILIYNGSHLMLTLRF